MPRCCSRSATQVVVGQRSNSGKGRNNEGGIKYGFSLVKGQSSHSMEDYHVAEFINTKDNNELGLFAIFDGHKGDNVAAYLQKHLFSNILKDGEFLVDPRRAILSAYETTDEKILSNRSDLGDGGSTAVTAVLVNGNVLWIANVGDSRAIVSRCGVAVQISVDHDPDNDTERNTIESKGGFVTKRPGDVARVNGLLAVSRVFGDKNLKPYLNMEPDIKDVTIDSATEFLILASDGITKVMSNQEAVDIAKRLKDPKEAAKRLIVEALKRNSKDDISCIVVWFK